MGLSKFLKQNAGVLGGFASKLPGAYGQLGGSAFGVLDAREQEKAAAKNAAAAAAELRAAEARRSSLLAGVGGAPRSSGMSLFEETDLGGVLPQGVSPLVLLGGAAALLLILRR